MTSWQTKKLGDIGESIIGLTYSPNDIHNSGLEVLRSSNIQNGRIDLSDIVRVTTRIPDNLILKNGDILVCARNGSRRLIGKNVYIDEDNSGKTFGAFMCVFRTDQSKYVKYLFQSEEFQRQVERDLGPTINQVTSGNLNSFKFNFPEKPEQERIVSVLEVWDEYLEKLEQKILLKEQLKIALMQQLFFRKNRLAGFNKKWLDAHLKDVAIIERGKSLTSSQIKPGDYPVIAGGKTSPYKHADYTHEDVITVSASGASAGYAAYQARKIWASDSSVVYGKNQEYLTVYIYYWMHFMQDRIYTLQTGGAQPHVQPTDLRRLKISIPDKDEQLKIVATLGSVDVEINLLEKLKKEVLWQKKYLLKNLITGTIRTPETLTRKDLS